MKIIITIAVIGIICLVEVPPLLHNNYRRELFFFTALIIPESVLLVLIAMDIEVPSPVNNIEFIVQKTLTFVSAIIST